MLTNPTAKQRVLVGLSGGVDSTVCVHLLQKSGYDVTGVVLNMSPAHADTVTAATDSAKSLGIPLVVRDLTELFQKNVIDYFAHAYLHGQTPNPCVVCNPTVKFWALIDTANQLGCEKIATGHYAGLRSCGDDVMLTQGASRKRDQSYMLYRLDQSVLRRLLLPLSELEKDEVRQIASQLSVAAANKPDSQENCFIPDNDYAGYIERYYGKSKSGVFISPEGNPCGTHAGILHYTVGQRKGLGIALGRPVFVREIDPQSGNIYLADSGQEYFSEVTLSDVTTTNGRPLPEGPAQVKIRSMAPLCDAVVRHTENGVKLIFDSPQRATAKGQSAVVYHADLLLGGGFIAQSVPASCNLTKNLI